MESLQVLGEPTLVFETPRTDPLSRSENTTRRHRAVLMLMYPYAPFAAAGTFRGMRFVKYLPESGWDPLVVTLHEKDIPSGRIDESLREHVPEGVIVRRAGLFRPIEPLVRLVKDLHAIGNGRLRVAPSQKSELDSSPSSNRDGCSVAARESSSFMKSLRALKELLFETPDGGTAWMLPALATALPLLRKHRPRVIYSTGPPHSSHLIAVVLKKLTGIPIVIDLRDPWARCQWAATSAEPNRRKVQEWLERLCVSTADCVILNTSALRDEFESRYDQKCRSKFRVIPNGYDPDLRRHAEWLLSKRTGAMPDAAIRLCHPGRIYGERTLCHLMEAIQQLAASGRRVVFEQIGLVDGEDEAMRSLRERLPAECVFRGQLPHDETLERMAAADVLVVVQPGTSIQVPGKLFEMLPFRKPILALTGEGGTADIVRKFHLGAVADPADPRAIASAILDVAPGQSNGHLPPEWDNALSRFDGRRLAGTLAEALNSVL